MIEESSDSLCIFTQRDDGICEFVFKKASRFAVDSFWNQLERIFEVTAPGDVVLCLMDWRQVEMPPLRYMAQRGKQLAQAYPNGPGSRLAIVHQPGTLLNMAQTMAQFMRSDTSVRRFFPKDQYNEAVAWLLKG